MHIKIINTTVLVNGGVGGELKFEKTNLINPKHIITIPKFEETENILRPF